MNKILTKNTFRSIRRSFGRFVAIMIIVATGFAFFAGIKAAGPDMLATAAKYYNDNNLMDLRIQSNIGLTAADAEAVSKIDGVDYVLPQKFVDALVRVDGNVESDIDGSQISARAYGVNINALSSLASGVKDPAFINRPDLLEGRYPTAENECLVDASTLSTPDSYKIGSVITLEGDDASLASELSVTDFTIVGIIRSPYYISFERGNSLVGSGKIGTFILIPDSVILNDYYSEIYVTVAGADKYEPYSDEYFEFVKKTADNISAVAPQRLSVRAAQLNSSLPGQIATAQIKLNALIKEADSKFSEAEANIEMLESLALNGDAILAAAQAEYNAQFSEQSTLLSDGQNEYTEQVNMYNRALAYVNTAKQEWNAKNSAYQAAQSEYNEKLNDLAVAKAEIENGEQRIATVRSMMTTTKSVFETLSSTQGAALNQDDIQNIVGVLEAVNPDLYNAVKALTAQGMASDAIALIQPQLKEYERQLDAETQKIDEAKIKFNESDAALANAKAELDSKQAELTSAKSVLDEYEAQLVQAQKLLDEYGEKLQTGGYALSLKQLQAQQQLAELSANVENADANLEKAQKELEAAKSDIDANIKYAKTVIDKGQSTLSKIGSASWSIYDRNDTPGYSGFGEAASNINTLAYIFPVFFVLVAAMVSLSTMTRMVEDERTQMGTFKALGYSNGQIMSKYIVYALLASIIGSAVGVVFGIYAFPYAIFAAYGIMYEFPPILIGIPWAAVAVGFAVFCVMSVLLSYYACKRELGVVPSVLMRAKAPKNGKRVFLEKVKFIWSRLGFTSKVTIRNTFRTPKRCIMTIVGIAGCTALLLAGLGMYDSVGAIMTNQFGENGIARYDMQIVFDEPQESERSSAYASVARDGRLGSVVLTSMTSMRGGSANSDKELDVYVLAPVNTAVFSEMVKLGTSSGDTAVLDDTGAVITEKLAETAKVSVGDSVTLTTAENLSYTVKVSAIVENYTFDYVYMTPAVYTSVFGSAPKYHYAMATLTDEIISAEAEASAEGVVSAKAQLAADLMDKVGVTAVAYTSDTVSTFEEVVKAMTTVVALLIVAAALLEMVVLYNLANVNVSERLREIATLKVVGFYDKEVSSYIYRENIILTVLGAVFGVVFGVLLHKVMIHFIVIDTVTYGKSIGFWSYIIAVAATLIFSLLVNAVMHGKLKKVSMVESFKSVD